jgi:metalloendopeptidase OMA1, mitochondrial
MDGSAALARRKRSLGRDDSPTYLAGMDRQSCDGTRAVPPCPCRAASRPRLVLTRRAALGLGLGGTVALAGCEGGGGLGGIGASLVDEDQVRQLGVAAFEDLKQKTPIVRDPAAQALVERIGRRVVAASGSAIPAGRWEFVVFDRPELNAFALPGGKVGVYRGMLRLVDGEAELATVIAHEVGHVVADHAAQRLGTSRLTSLGAGALSIVLDAYGVPVGPEATGLAAEYLVARPFSRGQELEADRLGVGYMAEAGYDPAEAIGFWRKMQAASGRGGAPTFLSTHPSDEARIAQLQAIVPAAERIYRRQAAG